MIAPNFAQFSLSDCARAFMSNSSLAYIRPFRRLCAPEPDPITRPDVVAIGTARPLVNHAAAVANDLSDRCFRSSLHGWKSAASAKSRKTPTRLEMSEDYTV